MNKITYIIFLFLFILLQKTEGQDVHFSQYDLYPLLNNPGNSGIFDGDFRISNIYRNQWQRLNQAYQTIGISYDQPVQLIKKNMAVGFFVINDQAGSKKLLTNKMYAGLAYNKFIGINQFSVGLQGGLVFRKLDYNNLTFPNQYEEDDYIFNSSLPSFESNINNRSTYFDINLGVVWRRKTSLFFPTAGFAIYHVNVPQLSFIDDNEWPVLKPRIQFFGDIQIYTSNSWQIKPTVYYAQQGANADLMLGNYLYLIPQVQFINLDNVNFGLFFRSNLLYNFDAIILKTGLTKGKWQAGLSYDISLSTLRKTSTLVGAFEISLIYTGITKIKEAFVPCIIM